MDGIRGDRGRAGLMDGTVAAIWRKPVPDWQTRLEACIRDAAVARSAVTRVFFRADDVAVPGARFGEMIQVFMRHNVPLNLAVVPAWLTAARWRALAHVGCETPHLWCWHQHGWRHHNHELRGKKQEFGPARPPEALLRDLNRGRQRLERLLGAWFFPVFTPPWNRCTADVLTHLQQSGYAAVSRSPNSRPACPRGLADMVVDIDLHTRKDETAEGGWRVLPAELARGLTNPVCGFMLHHQCMNPKALAGLDHLLSLLSDCRRFELMDFRQLCPP